MLSEIHTLGCLVFRRFCGSLSAERGIFQGLPSDRGEINAASFSRLVRLLVHELGKLDVNGGHIGQGLPLIEGLFRGLSESEGTTRLLPLGRGMVLQLCALRLNAKSWCGFEIWNVLLPVHSRRGFRCSELPIIRGLALARAHLLANRLFFLLPLMLDYALAKVK